MSGAGSARTKEVAERGLTQLQQKIEMELGDIRASFRAAGNDDPTISRLIALIRRLLSNQELIQGCGESIRDQQVQTKVCETKLECERHFGTERFRQLLDGLGLLAAHPNAESVAFARSVALDSRVGPVTRERWHAISRG